MWKGESEMPLLSEQNTCTATPLAFYDLKSKMRSSLKHYTVDYFQSQMTLKAKYQSWVRHVPYVDVFIETHPEGSDWYPNQVSAVNHCCNIVFLLFFFCRQCFEQSPSLAEEGRVLRRGARRSLQPRSSVPSLFIFLLTFSLRMERITLMMLTLLSGTLQRKRQRHHNNMRTRYISPDTSAWIQGIVESPIVSPVKWMI